MLTGSDKIKLNIVIWALVLGSLYFLYFFTSDRIILLDESIKLLEEQVRKHSVRLPTEEELALQKEEILEDLEAARSSLYKKDEIDLHKFSNTIWQMLVSHNLTVNQYLPVEKEDGEVIEFNVTGNPYNFFSFMKKVYESDKYWNINYINIKTNLSLNKLTVTFRIGYGEHDV